MVKQRQRLSDRKSKVTITDVALLEQVVAA